MPTEPLTYPRIVAFWLPLAGTWLMMAAEGPYLAAIIARLEQPTENLAAFGVAFALAIIIEAPVIMLMAASTALVTDAASYAALRRFTYTLAAALTLVQVVAVLPPVFDWLALSLIGLPPDVARLTHHGLAIMLPWPIAIGYRRFRQGLLIRRRLTRLVTYGTAVRLAAMSAVALAAARVPGTAGRARGHHRARHGGRRRSGGQPRHDPRRRGGAAGRTATPSGGRVERGDIPGGRFRPGLPDGGRLERGDIAGGRFRPRRPCGREPGGDGRARLAAGGRVDDAGHLPLLPAPGDDVAPGDGGAGRR